MYLDKIKYLAKAYTPEIDIHSGEKNAAYGIALAMADMFEDTAKNLDEVNQLYKRELVTLLGIHRQEGVAAEGIVSIALKPELQALLHIKQGTELYSSNENGSVIFTVKYDTIIKHNAVKSVVFSDARQDKIAFLDHECSQGMLFFDDAIEAVPRRIIFRQDYFFINGMTTNAFLRIDCEDYEAWMRLFLNRQLAKWYYVEGADHLPIQPVRQGNDLYFELRETLLSSRSTEDIPYIYVDLYQLGDLSLLNYKSIAIGGYNTLKPSRLVSKDLEILGQDDFMFGDMYSIYDCFYIGDTNCLSKKGALGRIHFDVTYKKVFKEAYVSDNDVKYKLIMKDEEFDTEASVDIEIEEVIWEYFNGNSWKRLLFDRDSELVFKQRQREITVEFLIPNDIATVFVNGEELYYVRCRIHKINNYAHLNGQFVTPIVNNVTITYDYKAETLKAMRLPKAELKVFNRYNTVSYGGVNGHIEFQRERDASTSIYIGFEEALAVGANTLYLDLENTALHPEHIDYSILYEYQADEFIDLRVLDNTDHLSTSGLLILFVEDEMKKKKLFGQSCYWIKITRRAYAADREPILVNRIIPNAVSIVQKEKKTPVYFKNYEVVLNQVFELPDQHIFETELYVNEKGFLNTLEYEALLNEGKLKLRRDAKGHVIEEWVRWDLVTSFDHSKPEDRVYLLDSNSGRISFGDNQKGRILPIQKGDVLEVSYGVSRGSKGNLLSDTVMNTVESMPSISEIVAVTAIQGGMPIETDQALIARGMAHFAHRHRMISIRDIESIVKSSIPQIIDAKCNRRQGGLDLIILPINENYDDFHLKIIDYKVKSLLKAYMGAEQLKVRVLRAQTLYIDVKVKLYVDDVATGQHLVFDIKERLKDIIQTKNVGVGQHIIGSIPSYQSIYDGILNQAAVGKIESLIIDYYTVEKGRHMNQNGLSASEKMYYVAKSAKHNIVLKMDR